MKKSVFGRKLSRERDTRRALFRSLARSLFLYGKIDTTKAKALAVVPFVDKILKKALKNKEVAKRRMVLSHLANDTTLVGKLLKKLNPDFVGFKFTTIVPLPNRRGDSAKMVSLRLNNSVFVQETKTKSPEKKTKAKVEKKVKK